MRTPRLLLLVLAALAGPTPLRASAQGAILFANRVPDAGINAPVAYFGNLRPGAPFGTGGLASGSQFLAQLAVNGHAVGTPQPFRTGAAAGYISSTLVTVPGIPGGTTVTVTMLAWVADLGATYGEAVAKGLGMVGASGNLQVTLAEPPNPPPYLIGLQPFTLWPIPEPAPGLLALLGAAGLFLRRRPKIQASDN